MKKALLPLLLILALLLCSCQVLDGDGMVFSSYRSVSQEEAARLMASEKNYIILDVRRPDEFDSGHIKGAINIPNEEIDEETEIPQLPDKDQLIFVYCRAGHRSKEASQKLFNMGYTAIVEFGGIETWEGEIETSPAASPEPGPEENEEIELTITTHSIVTEAQFTAADGSARPLARASYPEVTVTAGGTDELAAAISAFNEDMRSRVYTMMAQEYLDADTEEDDSWRFTSDSQEITLYPTRGDGKTVSFSIMIDSFFNGPHPFVDYEAVTFDARTGKVLDVEDVLSDQGEKDLEKNIFDNLQDVTDGYEYSEAEQNEIKTRLRDMIESGSLCWNLTERGIDFDFDAYDLMYYAFGPMFATLSYDEYGYIFDPEYLPDKSGTLIDTRVTQDEAEDEVFTANDVADYISF
ncbi:MAG: rhodanese-like domain-containing protein [Oscillospiraceae bacterium]|nr:rhodanese-like domain-containing protein [Oscillospiraceae bacterium]